MNKKEKEAYLKALRKSFLGTNKKDREQRIKWFTLALVLFFIFLFFLLAVNLMSSGGSYSIRTSTTEDNSWWGTTHETTDYGLRGKKVTTHNCPFWDRDC